MDLRSGILATANAIGANPLDLATIISYETAGTFDPAKRGPTTQWGQHKGLIQFGEPQAQQYGVNWDDPIGSQLGPDGAVAKYFKASGYQPGMGLLDMYSTVNAGAPGRYNASDANNGGAPGTVADKVNGQMSGHRTNAERLMGEQIGADTMAAIGQAPTQNLTQQQVSTMGAPDMQPQEPQGRMQQMLGKVGLGDPDRRARLAIAMQGMTLNPNQGLIDTLQGGIDGRADEKKANRTAEWLRAQGRDDLADAVASGTLDGKSAATIALTPAPQQDSTAMMQNVQWLMSQGMGMEEAIAATKSGAATTVNVGDQAPTGPQIGTIPQGYQGVQDPVTGKWGYERITGGPEDNTNDKAAAVSKAQQGLALVDSILNDPKLASVTGMIQGNLPPMTQGGTDLNVKIEQLKGQAFLQAFESLKGGGAITEREGAAASAAMARLDRAQSTEAYKESLSELQGILQGAIARASGGIPAVSTNTLSPEDLQYLEGN